MSKITVIGAGNAFSDIKYGQSNFLLSHGGKNLLIDCGSDAKHLIQNVLPELNNGNIHKYIDAIYISHLHGDHIGGLEWIGFCTYFNFKANRIPLYINEDLVKPLWKNCLKGTMQHADNKLLHLENYFNIKSISNQNPKFDFNGLDMRQIKLPHVSDQKNSYGLTIYGNKRIFWTSDCALYSTLSNGNQNYLFESHHEEYKNADIIIHDCETTPYETGVHSHYIHLKKLPNEIKKKMLLYHYSTYPYENAVRDGFLGFLEKGGEIIL